MSKTTVIFEHRDRFGNPSISRADVEADDVDSVCRTMRNRSRLHPGTFRVLQVGPSPIGIYTTNPTGSPGWGMYEIAVTDEQQDVIANLDDDALSLLNEACDSQWFTHGVVDVEKALKEVA